MKKTVHGCHDCTLIRRHTEMRASLGIWAKEVTLKCLHPLNPSKDASGMEESYNKSQPPPLSCPWLSDDKLEVSFSQARPITRLKLKREVTTSDNVIRVNTENHKYCAYTRGGFYKCFHLFFTRGKTGCELFDKSLWTEKDGSIERCQECLYSDCSPIQEEK